MNKILSIQETKEGIIDFLYSRGEYIRLVHGDESVGGEYQTRCPYCEDSQKEINTGHFYMKILIPNKNVIPVHCFKCNYGGILMPEALDLMGCNDQELRNGLVYLNKTGNYEKGIEYQEDQYRYFERVIPDEYRYQNKLGYIDSRLGVTFTMNDYREMKVITSLYDFLVANNITESPFTKQQRMILEKDYIGFLSSGNSHILFRDVTDTHKDAWVKYPIDKESSKNKVWYGLACEVDIFTEDDITINLCEGVMDIIGIKSHLGMSGTNIMNIAVTGQNYNSLILHLIAIGLVGGNVTLNIFSDNDKVYSDNNNRASTEKFHRKYLERYKPLYKNINLYYNMKSKDYGVKKEEIALRKIQI